MCRHLQVLLLTILVESGCIEVKEEVAPTYLCPPPCFCLQAEAPAAAVLPRRRCVLGGPASAPVYVNVCCFGFSSWQHADRWMDAGTAVAMHELQRGN
jgi:hypothetical protein